MFLISDSKNCLHVFLMQSLQVGVFLTCVFSDLQFCFVSSLACFGLKVLLISYH